MDTDMEAVIREAKAALTPVSIARGDLLFLPDGEGSGQIVDLEGHAEKPSAVRGGVCVLGAASFGNYWKRFAQGDSTIYAHPTRPSIVAVMDHAGAGTPAWEGHTIRMLFNETPAWIAWKSKNRQSMSQADFADFIEDNLRDISKPAGADMLEMVTDLQAGASRTFRQAINLGNGQIAFEATEVITSRTGSSKQMILPTRFELTLALYEGLAPVSFTARLRYRINEGQLKFAFVLDRPEDVVRGLVMSTIDDVRAACGGDSAYLILGDPASARGLSKDR